MELKEIGYDCFDFSMIALDTAMAAKDAMNQCSN